VSTTPADTGASSAGQGAGTYAPEQGMGVPIAVGSFGFSVLVLGLANAELFTPDAIGIFVPVAMATGALGLFTGGLFELRANNIFAGTFALFYAGFLFSTALILRYFSPGIIDAAGDGGFGDAFGAWLVLWGIFTVLLSVGAYHINMPAFLAFVLLAIPYFLLGFANIIGPGDTADLLTQLGGWILIADGAVAWYLSWALAVNPLIEDRLPLWPYPYSTSEKGVSAGIAPSATG
jgi:succinate-acetate transporter protein